MTIVCIGLLKLQKFHYMILRLVYGVLWVQWELLVTFFLEPNFVVMCNTYPGTIFEHLSDDDRT
jgi:hypothetical protein